MPIQNRMQVQQTESTLMSDAADGARAPAANSGNSGLAWCSDIYGDWSGHTEGLGVSEYIENGFFNTPRYTGEVVNKIKDDFEFESSSSNVSAILRRFVNDGFLSIIKDKRRNLYFKK